MADSVDDFLCLFGITAPWCLDAGKRAVASMQASHSGHWTATSIRTESLRTTAAASNAPLPPLEVLVSTHLAIPVALDLGPGPRTVPLTSDHGPGTKANHSHRSLVNSFPLSLGSSAPVSASALPGRRRGWWQRRSLSVLDLRDPHPSQDSAPMHVHRPCVPSATGEVAWHGHVEHEDLEHGLQEASLML